MSKVAVVFWSQSGNTEEMAKAIVEGAKEAGAEADLFYCEDFNAGKMDEYNAVAFGCPAMGDEVLEEEVFEPIYKECEPKINGKKIALFGSYGWGDGEWMRNWDADAKAAGAVMACDFVICNEMPDDDGIASCKAMGKALA